MTVLNFITFCIEWQQWGRYFKIKNYVDNDVIDATPCNQPLNIVLKKQTLTENAIATILHSSLVVVV